MSYYSRAKLNLVRRVWKGPYLISPICECTYHGVELVHDNLPGVIFFTCALSSMLFSRFLFRFGLSGQLGEWTWRLNIKKDVIDFVQKSALIVEDHNVFLASTLASRLPFLNEVKFVSAQRTFYLEYVRIWTWYFHLARKGDLRPREINLMGGPVWVHVGN